ncbi:MAG: hypothetical protein ABI402_09320 [Ferruginibacter sp.]
MKQPLLLSILIFVIFLFSSCYRIILTSFGTLEKSVSVKKISNTKKEVVFIPMHHIGKSEFYEDVKKVIDSLRREGYTLYYEAVKVNKENDSLQSDTLRRKMRQVVGADPFAAVANGGYLDTVNHTIFNKKLRIIKKEHLVNQRSRIKLGIDTLRDTWADVYLSDLIPAYEKKYGNIVLTDCDFNTNLSDKYSCQGNKNSERKMYALAGYRNEMIVDKILKDANTKIAIVYGSKHYSGILAMLQQKDSTWKKY